jgi:ribosomal protein S10
MIFFDYYFKAHATPKYLEPIAISMERRHQALMADEPTLKKFIEELKSELNSIPKAKERYELKADKGYIYINTTHGLTEAVLRLHYKKVLSLEGFNHESFENICKSINEVAEKKGGTR